MLSSQRRRDRICYVWLDKNEDNTGVLGDVNLDALLIGTVVLHVIVFLVIILILCTLVASLKGTAKGEVSL